jgi:hypothetical protein
MGVRTFGVMRARSWFAVMTVLIGACDGRSEPADTTATAAAAPSASPGSGDERTACRLLTGPEVVALAGRQVAIANITESEPGYSACQWEDSAGVVLFAMKAYWRGGRQQFDIWRRMQRLGDDIFRKEEGVTTDSIVNQGPVPGLGDAAYFGELFPSLLLKGDAMLEFTMSLVPDAGVKFRALATRLLERL